MMGASQLSAARTISPLSVTIGLACVGCHRAVVFNHESDPVRVKDAPILGRILLDDRKVGDHNDDAFKTAGLGVDRAKAKLARVLPPPVGTVSEKNPFSPSAEFIHWSKTWSRTLFTLPSCGLSALSRATRSIKVSILSASRHAWRSRPVACLSASSQSASTRHEKSIRYRIREPAGYLHG